ncbi:MAG: prepilin-type N-terminal cleavage/methylation domain-containing protein, partial [Gemmataceae bacterium]|nr:prepilin-type N-terminal cleavage/methylation domain-containing protein [Gemmataceae bacterium]
MRSPGRRGGFTLIELLVVISILAILTGLGVGAAMRFRETATVNASEDQLKQLQSKLVEQ